MSNNFFLTNHRGNVLNRAIEKAKQNYFNNAILSNKNDPRKTSKTIYE